jgi:glycosyltransferase involved in cell wall biosynthesis
MSILIVHNQIAPYRLPLFNALKERYDVKVLFCYERGDDKFWSSKIGDDDFKYKVQWSIAFHIYGRKIYINPLIVLEILLNPPNVVILTLNYETIITTFLAYLTCRITKTPYCMWVPDNRNRVFKPTNRIEIIIDSLYTLLKKNLVKRSKAVIAYGRITKEYVVKSLGKSEDKVFVGSQVWPEKKELISRDYFESPFKFLYLGYTRQHKRIKDLIDVFTQFQENYIELIIAGDGPVKKSLEDYAMGDERIKFTGYVEGADKEKLLKVAHVFVLPSEHDNLPNSIIEAMSYGLPIIATEECACPEWLESNSFTYNAGNKEVLKRFIRRLIDDRNLAEKMGRESFALAKKYDVKFALNAFSKAIEMSKQ